MKLRAIKHTLILAWIRQLAEESDGWLACKGVTDPKQIDAYKAGVQFGAGRIVSTLKLQGAVSVEY